MKSMNEYILEKTGLTVEAQEFAHNMKNFFSFEGCKFSEESMIFENVVLKEDINFIGLNQKLEAGKELKSLELRKNGWLVVSENEDSSYTVIKHSLGESFVVPSTFPVYPVHHEGGYEKFSGVNAIQLGAVADLQKVIASVKKLSIEDANFLKSVLGPSLEEKILRSIIDATLFDTPPANGQQNGV